ncbi:MAG: thiamine pyrophosphate-dependent enzyme [bacterium]|nr:thiamine pyrophosphate-dependent enzyme [bacterium]
MDTPKFPKSFKIESKPSKFCPGCGYGIILKCLGWVIDETEIQEKAVLMTDIGCNLLAWDFFDIPTCQTHHGRTVTTAVGYKLAEAGKSVICLIGDGGGYAIGLQNLLHACLRNTPLTVILANNTVYAMTSGQVSPTSLEDQVTDSTPDGKKGVQSGIINGSDLLRKISKPEAFIARTSTLKPMEIKKFLKQALETQKAGNFSFVEILSACPLNWKTNASETLERVKELEGVFAQGEINS